MDLKRKAFEQHTSQAPLMERTREMFRQHGEKELYALVAVREPQASVVLNGMFAGL